MNYQHLIECGVTQWNQWRSQHPNQQPNLSGLNLQRSYLFEVNLMGSNLSGVDLRRACLIGANLSQANLSGANLRGAYLSDANLREANLSNADLTGAQMTNADLLRANLLGTCLAPAKNDTIQPLHASSSRPFLPEMQQLEHVYQKSVEPSNRSTESTLTSACIAQCQQQLTEYYIVPIANMLVDDIIATHHPKNARRLVALISEQLSHEEAERFSQHILSRF